MILPPSYPPPPSSRRPLRHPGIPSRDPAAPNTSSPRRRGPSTPITPSAPRHPDHPRPPSAPPRPLRLSLFSLLLSSLLPQPLAPCPQPMYTIRVSLTTWSLLPMPLAFLALILAPLLAVLSRPLRRPHSPVIPAEAGTQRQPQRHPGVFSRDPAPRSIPAQPVTPFTLHPEPASPPLSPTHRPPPSSTPTPTAPQTHPKTTPPRPLRHPGVRSRDPVLVLRATGNSPETTPPRPLRHPGVRSRDPVLVLRATGNSPGTTPRSLKSFLEKTLTRTRPPNSPPPSAGSSDQPRTLQPPLPPSPLRERAGVRVAAIPSTHVEEAAPNPPRSPLFTLSWGRGRIGRPRPNPVRGLPGNHPRVMQGSPQSQLPPPIMATPPPLGPLGPLA